MSKRLLVIRGGYVINVVEIGDDAKLSYPHPHDELLIDEGGNVGIGDWYAANEKVFYRPLSAPPDLPDELR